MSAVATKPRPAPPPATARREAVARVALAGVWLGALQTALFFELTLLLSSSFVAYAVLLVSWLGGSIAGVWVRARTATRWLVAGAAIAPYALHGALTLAPYSLGMLPVAAALTGACGAFAGHLFQAERRSLGGLDRLFFVEGLGFLAGLAGALLAALLVGRGVLWAAPGLGGLVLIALYTRSQGPAEAAGPPRPPARPAASKPPAAGPDSPRPPKKKKRR